MIAGNYTTTAPGYTITTSTNTSGYIPFPQTTQDFVEFGKTMDVSKAMINDLFVIKSSYDMVLTDYFKEKAINFPNWEGLPEIKHLIGPDPLQKIIQIGWYAKVPKAFVIDKDQKEEESLWDS